LFLYGKKIFSENSKKKILKEADKVVTNRFDVSMIPTTELIDTARMPLCTYTVRRGSVNGPIVTYASVGEPVFHVKIFFNFSVQNLSYPTMPWSYLY